jgi:hypothetical protein
MRRFLLLLFCQFGLLTGGRLYADVVTLKDGRQISGSVESGNTQELHIKVGDQSQTIDIHDVQAIRFGASSPAPPPKAADLAPAAPEPAPALPNSLILNDGTHVAGRWWSVDATSLHFLVNNQLQHYPRPNVSGVTFGAATLPPPPARSPLPPATSAPPPASAAQPAPAPALAPSSAGPPPPPTLMRPNGGAPPSTPPAPSRGLSQPEEIGMVYFWNGKLLIPLETSQAVELRKGSTEYFEIPAPQSRVRLNEDSILIFILRLPPGVDPAGYSLFPLVTADGSRRTRTQPGRRGGLLTWPVHIEINNQSSLITYALTAKDLPAGEYAFSQSGSNDSYCFGVDPSAPGQ